jgi:anti-sigma B factor antagonist
MVRGLVPVSPENDSSAVYRPLEGGERARTCFVLALPLSNLSVHEEFAYSKSALSWQIRCVEGRGSIRCTQASGSDRKSRFRKLITEWTLSKCKGGMTMTMEYTTRQSNDVTILDLTGRLSLGEAVAFGPGSGLILSETVRELAKKGRKNILLNLAGVTYVDSSGVGQLVGAMTSARNQGVSLKLLRPNTQVLNLLKMSKLDTVFDISEDEATAVASFTKGAAAGG